MRATPPPTLWLVVPCYNEGSLGDNCLRSTAPLFERILKDCCSSKLISPVSKICLIDDGSQDDTWETICDLVSRTNSPFTGIKLSRNCGHQNALFAGLMEAREQCDVCISLDCDGQDDPSVICEMLFKYFDGYDIVYGVRSDRAVDSFMKRSSAEGFYRILSAMGVKTIYNHADFRLMSKRALNALSQYKEVNLYLRGLMPLIGFRTTTVPYERAERAAGQTHYPLRKMLALAIDGVTSMSVAPIRFIAFAGIAFSLLGLVGVSWAIVTAAIGHSVAGWTSTICVISLLGGLQLFCTGVIGKYIGKIYLEVKERPRYIIEKRLFKPNTTQNTPIND